MWIILGGATVVGLTLGLLGSGGSIMTVPVLTYLLGHESKVAIAESLAIVGGIALVATIPYARAKEIDWRSVVWFGIPGMAGTYLGAWLSGWISGAVQLVIFAVVMLLAAFMMARGGRRLEPSEPSEEDAKKLDGGTSQPALQSWWKIVVEGLAVGVLTGLVGVGGGFLIVPALVVIGRLPMKVAVGTSLAVIALKSAAGLVKYIDVLQHQDAAPDWGVVLLFIAIGVVGSLVGKSISAKLNQRVLRRGFAAFLVVMGIFVLGKEGATLFEQASEPATTHIESIETKTVTNWELET